MKNLLLFQSKSYKIGIRSDLNVFYLIGPPENEWCILGERQRGKWKWEYDYPYSLGSIESESLMDALPAFISNKMDEMRIAMLFNGFESLEKGIKTREISLFGMLTQDDPRKRLEKTLDDEGEGFNTYVSGLGEGNLIINKPSP